MFHPSRPVDRPRSARAAPALPINHTVCQSRQVLNCRNTAADRRHPPPPRTVPVRSTDCYYEYLHKQEQGAVCLGFWILDLHLDLASAPSRPSPSVSIVSIFPGSSRPSPRQTFVSPFSAVVTDRAEHDRRPGQHEEESRARALFSALYENSPCLCVRHHETQRSIQRPAIARTIRSVSFLASQRLSGTDYPVGLTYTRLSSIVSPIPSRPDCRLIAKTRRGTQSHGHSRPLPLTLRRAIDNRTAESNPYPSPRRCLSAGAFGRSTTACGCNPAPRISIRSRLPRSLAALTLGCLPAQHVDA